MSGPVALITFLSVFILCFGALLPVSVFIGSRVGRIRSWQIRKKLNKEEVIKAEYEPLKEFGPMELGFVYDGRIEKREIAAGLASLMQKGLVKKEKNLYFATGSKSKKVSIGEEVLLNNLTSSADGATLEALSKRKKMVTGNTANIRLLFPVSNQIEHELKKQNFVKKYYRFKDLWKIIPKRALIFTIIFAVIYIPILYQSTQVSTTESGITFSENGRTVDHFSPVAGVFFSIMIGSMVAGMVGLQFLYVIYRYNRAAGYTIVATKELKEAWIKIEGFRWFLEMTEHDNIAHELENDYNFSNGLMPFAIALEQTDKFTKFF